MYPQFAESQSVRGLPDMARNPVRFPYHQYYGSKMTPGDGMIYPTGPMVRTPINPYTGKPSHEAMYSGGAMSWNSMMGGPPPPHPAAAGMIPAHMAATQKAMMGGGGKPDYAFPGQEQMMRGYHPELMNSSPYANYMYPPMGGTPAYQPPPHPSYLSPHPSHHHHPGSMPPPSQMDGYSLPPPQSNNVWGDGSPSVSSVNSPGRNWTGGGHQDMMGGGAAGPNYQSSQSPQPSAHNDLQKGPSVSSLKDALSNPPPPLPSTQSLHDAAANKQYSFNTSSYLSVGAGSTGGGTSPQTPNVATPDPSTPNITGIIPNNETNNPSPLPAPQNDMGSHGNTPVGGAHPPSQNSPFEVESILGFNNKDTRTIAPPTTSSTTVNNENGRRSSNTKKSNSPPSSVSSPASTTNKKQRSPTFTTVIRSHPSLSSQYSMSDEPGRKDFLEALFKYMEQENIPFLKPPSINKSVLDLYKTFTAVQSLGGFTHVVNKRLWKDVLKSFCSATSPSSSSMRTLSEYYVNVLLPYECHFSHSNINECMSHYELSHRPPNETTPTTNNEIPAPPPPSTDKEPDRTKSLENLPLLDGNERENLIFSEDSLPDISVQEAESVLGISTSSAGNQPATPSNFPSGWASPSGAGDQSMGESQLAGYHPGVHPGPSYHGYYGMPDYSAYQRRMPPYMARGPYPGPSFQPPPMDDGSYNYSFGGGPMRIDEYGQPSMVGGGSDWPWGHPSMTQRLPPPLPPHLQSMMFSSTPPPPPPPHSVSPRPPTPLTTDQQVNRSSSSPAPPAPPPATAPPLDPIKIMVTDQGQTIDKLTSPLPPQKPSSDKDLPKQPQPQQQPTGTKETVNDKQQQPSSQQQPYKRPSEPIELLQPQMLKRRRLNCDHCGNVEPWRVMMSLKCGLPSDSTWALDTLTILLHDDRTVGFFYLKHHHSLLNTLVNHFNSCLFEVFGHPFKLLDKFDDSTSCPSTACPPPTTSCPPPSTSCPPPTTSCTTPTNESSNPPPTASVYHHTLTDIRMGLADTLCHLTHSSSVIDILQDRDPQNHPLFNQRNNGALKVDETRVEELLKRDALTERILLHLKTPRRLMARSPIQKYFLPPHQIEEEGERVGGCPSEEERRTDNSPVKEENEVVRREVLPFSLISSQRESLKHRTLSISNILRSLSFIPGNDIEFSQHPGLLLILGHLLLLHHVHLHSQQPSSSNYQLVEGGGGDERSTPPTITEDFWWWSCLDVLRENVFVILANIGGQLDFSTYPEAITYPLISGLLHWLVCPSSVATDPLPDSAMVYALSPQRLVVEALAKISISEANVDYILATPPLNRLDLVYATLLQFIGQKKYPAVRQFALVLLSDLAQGSEGASRMIGQQKMTLPLLLECLESSLTVTSKSRYMTSQYNDDANSLSLAMLRRAAITLHCIAKVPVNRISFLPYCNRILALSMTDSLDTSLTSSLSDVLYELNRLL